MILDFDSTQQKKPIGIQFDKRLTFRRYSVISMMQVRRQSIVAIVVMFHMVNVTASESTVERPWGVVFFGGFFWAAAAVVSVWGWFSSWFSWFSGLFRRTAWSVVWFLRCAAGGGIGGCRGGCWINHVVLKFVVHLIILFEFLVSAWSIWVRHSHPASEEQHAPIPFLQKISSKETIFFDPVIRR